LNEPSNPLPPITSGPSVRQETLGRPARRFLHVCYCCSDLDTVTATLVDGLGLRRTMGTPVESQSGAILGIDGETTSGADFVYDARGPRTSPAIEVQGWVDPPLVGRPHDDPTAIGIQALGFSVPAPGAVAEQLNRYGCSIVGSGPSPGDIEWYSLRDGTGVAIDLVADATLAVGESRMRHVRLTVADLGSSLPWYEGMGFDVIDQHFVRDGSFLGVSGEANAVVARLRLPDEPYEALLVEWLKPRSHGRHYSEPNHAGLFRAALGVDDTRASYEAMCAEGWAFDRPPMSVALTGTPVSDMWICFLRDPDGVPYELVERPRSSFRP
jgi:catechol 2,3-dioxygenase-like lactoylglutathione lyase family enzyme